MSVARCEYAGNVTSVFAVLAPCEDEDYQKQQPDGAGAYQPGFCGESGSEVRR